MNIKQYIVDSIASMIFWIPVAVGLGYFVLKLNNMDLAYLTISAGFSNFLLGGIYGRFLNWYRRVIIK